MSNTTCWSAGVACIHLWHMTQVTCNPSMVCTNTIESLQKPHHFQQLVGGLLAKQLNSQVVAGVCCDAAEVCRKR